MRLPALVLALTAACTANPDVDPHAVQTAEGGRICPLPEQLARFTEGAEFTVRVLVAECISQCAREVVATCSTRIAPDRTLTLDARATWLPARGGEMCPSSCKRVFADCPILGLTPGTYSLRSGVHSLSLDLPSTSPPVVDPSCL